MRHVVVEAEPEPLAIDLERTALVVIDMQRDFLEPGGFGAALGNDVSLLGAAVEPCRRLIAAARANGMLVVHTREGHRPDLSDAPRAKVERGAPTHRIGAPGPMGRILVRGEAGHDIVAALAPIDGEPVIDKPGKGAFYATDLHNILQIRGVETLLVCGVTTEICVHTTVREANDRGYRCVVPGDACASYFPEFHAVGLRMIAAQGGILGWVSDSTRVLAALESTRALTALGWRFDHDGTIDPLEETPMTTASAARPKLWVAADWNAFFGFGTNILVNLLVLTGLLRFVLKMPDALVFGRILPATGLMLLLSTLYYAFLAYRLAERTGRTDVCALPSGISVPHMFVVVFVIMLPILLKTGDPVKAWEAGLTWVFVQSFVLMAGGFVGPVIRRITPRAALLGSLAGVSITFISMSPAAQIFATPVIGVVCFGIIAAGWFGGVRYGGVPAGLVAIVAGVVIAWGSTAFGLNYGGMSVAGLSTALSGFGFSVPLPAVGHVFSGFEFIGVILVTAIPFGIYDLVEALDNVESAAVAGDAYPTTRVLTADGVISLIGCLMGNPFINAVYIGHPGWKAMGGRIGYSAATGIVVIALAWFGVVALMMALIPVVAILPILLYIGMLIGSQAFQETPHRHAPAVVLALIPQVAAWGKTMIDSALGAAGTNAAAVGFDKLGQGGVLYQGLATLGGGAVLSGMVLASVTVFVIEREFTKAAAFAAAGAVLTFFGLMHGESVGIGQTLPVAAAYALLAVFLGGVARFGLAARAPQAAPA